MYVVKVRSLGRPPSRVHCVLMPRTLDTDGHWGEAREPPGADLHLQALNLLYGSPREKPWAVAPLGPALAADDRESGLELGN